MSDHNGPSAPASRIGELIAMYSGPDTNVAEALCDRHPADAPAFTVIAPDLSAQTLTFGQLRERSQRMARVLLEQGVEPGDRVATLMGKSVDYIVTLMGIWRLGAVQVPLFTAFAPPAIAVRALGSKSKVIVCDESQLAKLTPGGDMPAQPPWTTIVAQRTSSVDLPDGVLSYDELMDQTERHDGAVVVGGEGPLIHIYTSGTTGTPKGVVVPVHALASFRAYMEFGLALDPDDVFWCAADPGWAYGLYYAILGPMTLGHRSLLFAGGFSADATWAILSEMGVTNFAAAPTVYRALRAAGTPPPGDLALTRVSSAGEPLTPDVNEWAATTLGVHVHDHYGQTEAGMLVNNHHHEALATPLRPGSMGIPMPGWQVSVLSQDTNEPAPDGTVGRIAVDLQGSPLAWFTGYHQAPDQDIDKFTPDRRWYLTGDTGSQDPDGHLYFTSRDDDVIIMAGYRIGPFEVESVLATHPEVVESAAIAVPDPVRGEVLEAHVVLRDPAKASPRLIVELQDLVKSKLAAHAYPRSVHFHEQLPKTPSGKIQRFVLRQQREEQLRGARDPGE